MPGAKLTVITFLALLAMAACGKKEPELPDPVLRSVSVSVTEAVVPTGGAVMVHFTVDEPGYEFSEVRLVQAGGVVPKAFTISSFAPGTEAGEYVATIRDTGEAEIYKISVCLAVVQKNAANGNEVLFSSSFFEVRSQLQYKGLLVETGLPVVYLDTENSRPITSKTEYVPGNLYIRGTDDYPSMQQTVGCSVRGRGNTTWEWPKKPYLVKLEEKTSLLGLPKHKRWILLANFMDRTLMRNLVSMHVSSLTSLDWTPRCIPVELVLNGKHKGSYLLIEQVRVDKNRVAITEMSKNDNAGDAVTGGYLLELDFHYDNEVQWLSPYGHSDGMGNGIPFAVKYPDPEDNLTTPQLNYIKNFISEVASVIYGENFSDPVNGYSKYLDVDSFVDYWLVYEVMCNHELRNPGSVYFHKDRGGKLTAGPCWDFDWGVLSFYTSGGATGLVNGNAIWYERLFLDPVFREKVKVRFQELLPALETIPDYMDECEALLTESARLNFAMWNPADVGFINGDERLSFHNAVLRLKSNYLTHLEVMKTKLLQ